MIEPMTHNLAKPARKAGINGRLLATRVQRTSELDSYLDAWRTLASDAPMRSPEWLLVWWRFYRKAADELNVVLFFGPSGSLVGLAPLYIEHAEKQRIVRLLGSGEASTNHSTWLCASGWETRIGCAVAEFLIETSSDWDQIHFESVDVDDTAIGATLRLLTEKGHLARKTPLQSCWKVALPSSWDDYLDMLSKSQRKRCRRLQRQYFDTGRVQLHRVSSAADFPRGFEVLLDLHSARWGEPDRPLGCFSDQRFREFHRAAALEFLHREQLLLVWLELDGRPIAVEYQFADSSTVYSYQAGMDPSVDELPPGNLSIMASIRSAIETGCRWFDFSRGDQPYKSSWGAAPASCQDIRIWPDRIAGRLEHGIWGVRIRAEQTRLQTVRWIKGRVSPHYIELGRGLLQRMGGRRMGPVKTGPAGAAVQARPLLYPLLQRGGSQ